MNGVPVLSGTCYNHKCDAKQDKKLVPKCYGEWKPKYGMVHWFS